MAQIELQGVSKKFSPKDDRYAVEHLTYTIPDGSFVSLLGPSGCGKSTTLNMIAGLESVTEGSIVVDGKAVEDLEPHKRDLAFVFQDYALYPHLSVADNIAFGLKMRKIPKAEIDRRVLESAEKLELENHLKRRPKALSGGQRQRVALARAIARRPGVLLFDEPLSNLDALLRDKTRAELKLLHADIGATSVYVTHDQEEAMSLSDVIAVMSAGRLEQYGTPAEIYRTPATEFVAGFVGKPRMNIFDATVVGPHRVRLDGTSLEVEVPEADLDGHTTVRLGLRPTECTLEPGSETEHDGTIMVVEPLGNATDIMLRLGEGVFIVREPGFSTLAPGDHVRLDAREAEPHVFDAETGNRLGSDRPDSR
ncbi:ABC transporter ATP-binding protein [Brachybacterium sacelli]|uniref:Multiple sugar transport system ATP-binding protein n=1 Tax=Brachybacterium sacelli TaxID=173364 RepID=A0ABS4WZ87_9MICO|nr:ABC transporter ATP-binding protein [Brachybacterium sacelli]MBP2381436.1 multiple sugar transport system ATP-binding protein [Brachybacterium sacelli]